jgi:hypothetical protein
MHACTDFKLLCCAVLLDSIYKLRIVTTAVLRLCTLGTPELEFSVHS